MNLIVEFFLMIKFHIPFEYTIIIISTLYKGYSLNKEKIRASDFMLQRVLQFIMEYDP